MNVSPYLKAIFGGAAAGLTAYGTALADGHVTAAEWVGILLAVVVTAGGVWGVTNAPMPGKDS